MRISICATGDNMHLKPFPGIYDFSSIANIIGANDIRITNLESVVSEFDCCASTYCGGQWINTKPDNLSDFEKWGGFNLISTANNHSMDYSYDGLLSTIKHLKARGLEYAGIGTSLKEASSAKIIQVENQFCEKIKVALISVTSTFIDAARAGDGKGLIPSRPGINPLRIETKYYVNAEHFKALQEIAYNTFINGERDNARKIGSLPPEDPDSLNFGGIFFALAENENKETICDKRDLNRIVREIQLARKEADYVIVSLHAHQIQKCDYFEPDHFQIEFAHACIDNGAAAVIGGGTHQLKPIEIYKGKPILYSLGNFCFQSGLVEQLPADFWDKYNYPIELSLDEAKNKKTKNGTVGLECDMKNYLSVIPTIVFENNEMTEFSLFPIELGFQLERELKGLPRVADRKIAEKICEQLSTISEDYNTTFKLVDDYIEVNLNGN